MSARINSLSLFFPAYNEAGNIKKTVESAVKVLQKLKITWEIIVVNDGSKDNTAEIVDSLTKKNSKIRLINQKNGGYGMALRTGFETAKYDWICYTDSDGQFDFSEISKFLTAAENADAVWGFRIKRDDPPYRKIFALIWQLSVFLLFGFRLKDLDCGFKLISRKALEKILPLVSTRGAMINAELALKLHKYGFEIKQVGVTHYPRKSGKPTGNSLNVVVRSYLELAKLRVSLTL